MACQLAHGFLPSAAVCAAEIGDHQMVTGGPASGGRQGGAKARVGAIYYILGTAGGQGVTPAGGNRQSAGIAVLGHRLALACC